MKKFNWAEFLNKNNKIAVHCKTEEEAVDFCEQMNKHGLRFFSGESYLNNNCWSIFEEKMTYGSNGTYGTQWDYSIGGWKIYEWSEYMEHEFTKDMLQTGMVVELRDGYKYQVLKDTVVGDALSTKNRVIDISSFCDDLTHEIFEEYDIIKIYQISKFYQLQEKFWNEIDIIWNREQPKKEPKKELWSNGKTLEENHRILWNWLADNPNKRKQDYFNEFDIEQPNENCFACEFAHGTEHMGMRCEHCPICNCEKCDACLNGLYDKFQGAKGYERATIAHEIANLKWEEK